MTPRQLRLSRVTRCRQALVEALPEALRRSVRAGPWGPGRTIEDHAHHLLPGQWGLLPWDVFDINNRMWDFKRSVREAMDAEVNTIKNLSIVKANPDYLGLAFETARRSIASEAGVPSGARDFKRYLGRAIGMEIKRAKEAERRPVKAPPRRRLARRGEPEPRSVQVTPLTLPISGEESLRLYTEEEDPKWRAFFGYEVVGATNGDV